MADDLDDPGSRRQHHQEEEKGEEPQKDTRPSWSSEIQAGITELERPTRNLALSGLSAGLDVSFSLLFMAVMSTLAEGALPNVAVEILVANMYSLGFVFVVLGRSELFTEHTTLAVLPVLDGRASLAQLGRLWTVVYVSNLAGAAAFAAFAAFIAPRLGIAEAAAFGKIAARVVEPEGWVILLSGLLAAWLMGLCRGWWRRAATRSARSSSSGW